MIVQELIDQLNRIKDKSFSVVAGAGTLRVHSNEKFMPVNGIFIGKPTRHHKEVIVLIDEDGV